MPVACDPNAKKSVSLQADKDKPAESRPTFYMRFLTRRQKVEYVKFGNETRAEMAKRTGDQTMAMLYEHLGRVIVGWKNLADPTGKPVEFQAGKLDVLDDVCTDRELWELYWCGSSDIDEADQAFFASRPSSTPAESAGQEAPAVETASA